MSGGELREFAKLRNFTIVEEFIDFASGRRTDREHYQRLLAVVRKRGVDAVLVWSYSRFARSTIELINWADELRSLDVDFISYQQNVDTTTPHGKLFFTIIDIFVQRLEKVYSSRAVQENILLC